MTLAITVTHDTEQAVRALGGVRRAIPKVILGSLSQHAFLSFEHQKRQIPVDINRPNPFTRNALRYTKARRARLESSVYVRPLQAQYLYRLTQPGVRRPLRRSIFIPATSQRTDPYGNMPLRRRRSAMRDPNTFFKPGRRANQRLMFKRQRGGKVQFMGVMVSRTRYTRKYWRFYEHALRHYQRTFRGTVNRQFRKYLQQYNRTG